MFMGVLYGKIFPSAICRPVAVGRKFPGGKAKRVFLKKEAKTCARLSPGGRRQPTKVSWFFFFKKERFFPGLRAHKRPIPCCIKRRARA
jgi:hypothetical protein